MRTYSNAGVIAKSKSHFLASQLPASTRYPCKQHVTCCPVPMKVSCMDIIEISCVQFCNRKTASHSWCTIKWQTSSTFIVFSRTLTSMAKLHYCAISKLHICSLVPEYSNCIPVLMTSKLIIHDSTYNSTTTQDFFWKKRTERFDC